MARAFKDMIVQEADGKPRLTFRNRQGAAVLEDVAVEVSSSVQQQGDAWGALAANLLLELDDDDVPYAVAPEFMPAAAPAALISREKLATAFGKLAAAVSALISHMGDKNNPHVTTAAQVGAYTKSETDAKLHGKANTRGTYSGLTAGNSLKIGGKTFSMNMNGDDLEIWWQ